MEHVPPDWEFDDVFDALELGCGQLLLDFRMHIRPLPDGARVMLATRDIASPREIPAWCRLTGHRLVAQSHPYYLIMKNGNHRKEE
jgi:tRNA 2-thiouridine synthesizing protein A